MALIDDSEVLRKFTIPVCVDCVNWHDGKTSCRAFKEIPDDIFLEGATHDTPLGS